MRLRTLDVLWRLGPQRLIQVWYHLPNFFKLFGRLLIDRRVSPWPKLMLVLVLVYVLAPLDLLPDLLVGLGQIDDLVLVFLGLRGFVKLCPPEVVREHVRAIAAGH
jgi:uncharacterized membrane protein YkvA (DUF1232 family)